MPSPTVLQKQIWPIIIFGPLAIPIDWVAFHNNDEDLQICFQRSAARMFGQQTYAGTRCMIGSCLSERQMTDLYNIFLINL